MKTKNKEFVQQYEKGGKLMKDGSDLKGKKTCKKELFLTWIRKDKVQTLLFIWSVLIPILILFILTSIVPLVLSLFATFFDWSLLGYRKFIGLDNWVRMLQDPAVWHSFKVTIIYTVITVIPSVVLGLLLAFIINHKVRFVGFFKSVYFLPVITSMVVIAGIWKWLFVADEEGFINQLLGIFGISPQFWYGKDLALITLALLGIFKGVGLIMVYYYAGLKAIPNELYEAARVDGSTALNSFFKITLPLLKPTTVYVLIVTTGTALRVFDSTYTLFNGQNGGPEGAANTLVYYVYRKSFFDLELGYGSTIGYLLFFIIFIISVVQYRLVKTDDLE